jgi:hypothetical protein
MRIAGIVFGLFVFVMLTFTTSISAQNPEQTRKHMRHWRKMARMKNRAKHHYVPKASDADGDGVEDNNDHCPNSPIGKKVNKIGCPIDSDDDGLADEEDVCPNKVGPRENLGCPWPDKDDDGIVDIKDDCPDQYGLSKFNGCPDSDKDGVPDKNDKCPDVIGVQWLQGCPEQKMK